MADTFDPYHKWLGIPPAEQPPNHYRLLGVTLFESDPDVIANAAEQRIVHVRAYQIGKHSDESQRILRDISAARVCLLNVDKKAEYDAQLRAAATAPTAASSVPAAAELAAIPTPLPVRAHHGPRKHKATWPLVLGGSAAAVAVVAFAIGLWSGGDKEAGQTAANPPAIQPTTTDASKPSPEASVGDKEPAGAVEANPSQAEQSATQDSSASKPTDQPQPKESGTVPDPLPSETPKTVSEKAPAPPAVEPMPAANTEPVSQPPPAPAENVPEKVPPPAPVAETPEQAEQRLKAELTQASTVEERRRIGQEALMFTDKAILASQAELARRLAVLALRAARDSSSPRLVTDATVLMSELATGISDALKDKAKQRLDKH